MFKVFKVHLVLIGWLSSLITALPTEHLPTSLITASPATKPPSLALSLEGISSQTNESHVNHLNASQIIHYSVPQTQMILVIYTGISISGPAMRDTLDLCLTAAQAIIDKYGNVFMFPDPNFFEPPPKLYAGLKISTHSTMVPGLKWIDLINALNGIEQVVSRRALYKEMHIEMYDEPSSIEMGIMDVRKSSPRI